ncbi:MAG: C25 family cysteine peptidase, partial [Polyangia bacterium]
ASTTTGVGSTISMGGATGAGSTTSVGRTTGVGASSSVSSTTGVGGTTSPAGTASVGGTTSEERDAAADLPPATDATEDGTAMGEPDGASLTKPSILVYTALIVTNDAYAAAFQQLAQIHTLTGVPTQVVTVETLCGASATGCHDSDGCSDTSKVVKDYLINQRSAGLHHVVLGGDMTIVPSRQTSDSYSNALLGVSYNETFYTDYYFADLSQWDSNGDCIYGDPNNDSPDYLPELDVTRISVSSPSELQSYITKVESYLTAYDIAQIDTALFLSNVATEISVPGTATSLPVDSASYFESPGRTLSFMPSDFAITKLYSSLGSWPGAKPLTVAAETAAFEKGFNLVVHSGHGNESDLTVEQDGSNEFSGAMAYALQNGQYPIMVSCACDAATFADGDGCAGQNFITAPQGGGVGYLGNSTIGLGIAGGMQFIDQFLKYTFATPGVLVGEAVMAGHAYLPTSDWLDLPVPFIGSLSMQVVDANSWRWTEKAATYLGDGLLPIYASSSLTLAPTFSITDQRIGDFVTITFQPTRAVSGTLAVAVTGNVYQFVLAGSGKPVSLTVGGSPSLMSYGFSSSTTLASYQRVTLP